MTPLAQDSLATGDRAICQDCMGRGRRGGREGWPFSQCNACRGKGVVCPACRGMRFVRQTRPDAQAEWQTELARCNRCCEGNQINDVIEMREIRKYIEAGQKRKASHDPTD